MYAKVDHLGVLTRAVRNVSRRKMRALLVIIALGFSMAIMISIPSGIVSNQEVTQGLTENYNTMISNYQEQINKTTTLIEVSASSGRGEFSSTPSGTPSGPPSGMPSGTPQFRFGQEEVFTNETVGDEIRTIEGVKDVVPFLEKSSNETTSETMSTPRGSFNISRPLYTITGVCLNSSFIEDYSILPTNITAGSPLQEGDSGVLLMSSNLADYYGKELGDMVEIYGESFTIVGIYEPTSQSSTEARGVYMNISDAQRITDNVGNVSRYDVYTTDVSYVDDIAETIKVAYSNLYVTTYEDRLATLESMQEMYTQSLNNAESTLAQTQATATQEIIIAVVATSLIVLFVMLYTVRERTKEIGILKAIGFSNWNIMSQFMLEGILISIIAGVVGIAIGSVAAPFLTSVLLPRVNLFSGSSGRFQFGFGSANSGTIGSTTTTVSLTPELILLAFGAAILLGALGSLYPAWRASRTSPMEALRYE
jgi:putative ABC transport system permease protein